MEFHNNYNSNPIKNADRLDTPNNCQRQNLSDNGSNQSVELVDQFVVKDIDESQP